MKQEPKNFLLSILALVIVSIISIASISTYLNISIFKQQMNDNIKNYKKEFLERNKKEVYRKVRLVDNSIKYQINKIENNLKESLKDRIKTSLKIAQYIYNRQKGKMPNKEIKKRIAAHLSSINFNENRGYYFTYDAITTETYGHIMKKFIGALTSKVYDTKGVNIHDAHIKALKNNNIAFVKRYFYKPNDKSKGFPKIVCVGKFEPLNLIIGTGEYLDVIEKQIKMSIIDRFKDFQKDKNNYLFFLDLHNINGGDKFATVILNSNRPDLIGRKINDNNKDLKGQEYRKSYLKNLRKSGEGYTKYWYKKPNKKEIKLKMSYFYLQKDWNWIIASGFYFEDIEMQINKEKMAYIKYTNDTIYKTLFIIGILSFIIIIIAILVSLRIDKTIKDALDELDQKNKNFKYLLDTTMEAIVISNENGNIINCNEASIGLFDFEDKSKLIGKNIINFVAKHELSKLQKSLTNKYDTPKPYDLLKSDGTLFHALASGRDMIMDDKKVRISIVLDLTDIKEQEKILFSQAKMANMGAMIGNIAHQWKQPLSIISMTSSNIRVQKDLGVLDIEDLPKETIIIEKQVQYLSNTIDTFRNFLKEKKEFKEVTLQDRIDLALHISGLVLKDSGIELKNNIDYSNPINISLVIGELAEVIINIINNARDILIERNIQEPWVLLDLIQEEDKVIITIEDNGGGIPTKILPNIFDEYFTTKSDDKGTGLGLHMSYQIICNSLQGKIYAKNTENGAKFFIELSL